MFDVTVWPHEAATAIRDEATALAGQAWNGLAAMPLNPATIALAVFLAGVALAITDGLCRRLAALLTTLVAPLTTWAQRKAIGAATTAPYRRKPTPVAAQLTPPTAAGSV